MHAAHCSSSCNVITQHHFSHLNEVIRPVEEHEDDKKHREPAGTRAYSSPLTPNLFGRSHQDVQHTERKQGISKNLSV